MLTANPSQVEKRFHARATKLMQARSLSWKEAAAIIRADSPELYRQYMSEGADDEYNPENPECDDDDDEDDDDEDEKNKASRKGKKGPGARPVPTDPDGKRGSRAGSSLARFDAAVARKMAAGMSRVEAASAVNREHPGLRQAAVDEVNGRKTSTTTAADHGKLSALRQQYEREISAKMAAGRTRIQATADVAKSHPELRQALVEAANSQARKGR